MGTLYNSKYKSGPMVTMSQKFDLITRYKDDTPGPGSYILFSEFGMLVPKKYKKITKFNHKNKERNPIKDFFKKKIMKRVFSEEKSLLKRDRITSATS